MAENLTRTEAESVIAAPKSAIDVAPAWIVHHSLYGTVPVGASLTFAVSVDTEVEIAKELFVQGELKGDLSHVIRLCLPRSGRYIARLCNNEGHSSGPTIGHWHWFGEAVTGSEEDELEPDLPNPPDKTNPDDMLAVFCERLHISGTTRQRSLT